MFFFPIFCLRSLVYPLPERYYRYSCVNSVHKPGEWHININMCERGEIPMHNFRLQFPERFGLLGLVGLVGILGYAMGWSILKPWIASFAAFSLLSLRLFNERHLQFPERLGLIGSLGFLGFLGFIPGVDYLKFLFVLGFFGFFFSFLALSQRNCLQLPARLGFLGFLGCLGFLGFIPGVKFLMGLFGLFGFMFFFGFLGRSQMSNQ